jgi:tetratricopeptide (TPR) repeat protein
MMLADFTAEEAASLVELKLAHFFGKKAELPPVLLERIISGAGGNPFYIEELLNFLQDRNIAPDDIRALEALDLPDSLHSLILSRIDQLTESQKSTIKVASVVGRLFKAMMLWGAYPQLGQADHVKIDLDTLSRLDLTPLDTPEPELIYLFKSIITQEVAYNSMPYATRAMLHDMVGRFIELEYRESLEQYIDLLAHHYEHSENEAKKREYLLKAGEAAQADYNNATAITYYEKVLPLLPLRERTQVLLKLGNVLELVGRWDEAGKTYHKAMNLSQRAGNRQQEAWAQTATAELLRKQGQYAAASEWLAKAKTIFEEANDQAGVGQVLKRAGTVAAQQGNYEEATSLYEASLILHRELDNQPEVASLVNNLGIIARLQNEPTVASYFYNESLSILRRLGDRRAIAVALNNLGNLALDNNDYAKARAYLEEALKIQREVGDKAYIANFLNNLGNMTRAQGDYEAATDLYIESLRINQELGEQRAIAYLLEDMGCLAAMQAEARRAWRLVGCAATLLEAIGAPLSPSEQDKLNDMLAPARQLLGELRAQTALAEAGALSLEEAIAYALSDRLPEFA